MPAHPRKPPGKIGVLAVLTPRQPHYSSHACHQARPERRQRLSTVLTALSCALVVSAFGVSVQASDSKQTLNGLNNGGITGTGGGTQNTQLGFSGAAGQNGPTSYETKYSFDTEEIRSVRFSRDAQQPGGAEHRTEFQFKLSPGKFDFSRAGGFGLGGVFSNPEFAMRSSSTDRYSISNGLPELHDGLSYSAGINIEHENAHISDTAYVSSGQLGMNYGRMGRVWYNGLDVRFQQSASHLNVSEKMKPYRLMSRQGVDSGSPA